MERNVMKDSELRASFAAQLATGKPFICAIQRTKNNDFVQLEIAQEVPTSDSPTEGLDLNAIFLGWNSSTILRAWRNVDLSKPTSLLVTGKNAAGELVLGTFQLKKSGMNPVGMLVEEMMAIEVLNDEVLPFTLKLVEYTEETDPMEYHSSVIARIQKEQSPAQPKRNPSTDAVVKHNGYPVYRKTDLVQAQFDKAKHIQKLPADVVSVEPNVQIARPAEAPFNANEYLSDPAKV